MGARPLPAAVVADVARWIFLLKKAPGGKIVEVIPALVLESGADRAAAAHCVGRLVRGMVPKVSGCIAKRCRMLRAHASRCRGALLARGRKLVEERADLKRDHA